MAKISINFLNDDSDADLLVNTGRVLDSMTSNPNFPTPDPTLAVVGTAHDEFDAAVSGLDGSSDAFALRDVKRAALTAVMRDLAVYVQKASGGDLVKILSSGFPVQKERQPVAELDRPQNMRLSRPGMSGQLKARCTPVDNAVSYQWRWATTTAPTNFTMVEPPTTAASVLLEGLTPGVYYTAQVRAIGTKGLMSEWSDPSTLMAT